MDYAVKHDYFRSKMCHITCILCLFASHKQSSDRQVTTCRGAWGSCAYAAKRTCCGARSRSARPSGHRGRTAACSRRSAAGRPVAWSAWAPTPGWSARTVRSWPPWPSRRAAEARRAARRGRAPAGCTARTRAPAKSGTPLESGSGWAKHLLLTLSTARGEKPPRRLTERQAREATAGAQASTRPRLRHTACHGVVEGLTNERSAQCLSARRSVRVGSAPASSRAWKAPSASTSRPAASQAKCTARRRSTGARHTSQPINAPTHIKKLTLIFLKLIGQITHQDTSQRWLDAENELQCACAQNRQQSAAGRMRTTANFGRASCIL